MSFDGDLLRLSNASSIIHPSMDFLSSADSRLFLRSALRVSLLNISLSHVFVRYKRFSLNIVIAYHCHQLNQLLVEVLILKPQSTKH